MSSTTFSGPVTSTNGFVGAVTATTVTATTVTATNVGATNVGATNVGATTVTATNVIATGANNVIVIPTSDPGLLGAIWNNGGVLNVSAG
jgi:hypothetical protein